MRRLIYFIACSADGFIAREDGSVNDFTFEGEHVPDMLAMFPETIPTHLRKPLKVSAENQQFDTVLMGRRTYEPALSLGVTSPYSHLEQYVISRSMKESPDQAVTLINSDVLRLLKDLKGKSGKDIWLCGGGELASHLVSEIDQLILKINPFLMGSGKTLFARSMEKTELQLQSHKTYSNGYAMAYYALNQSD